MATLFLIIGLIALIALVFEGSRENSSLTKIIIYVLISLFGFIQYSALKSEEPRAPWEAPHAGEATGK